jgi:hypothetical protein
MTRKSEMTRLEAIELIWERATPKVPGADLELDKAHSIVGKLLKNPEYVEFKAVGLFDQLGMRMVPPTPTRKTSGE